MEKILIKTKILSEEGTISELEFVELVKNLSEDCIKEINKYAECEEEISELGLITTDDTQFIPNRFICSVPGFFDITGILRMNDEYMYLEINREALCFYKEKNVKIAGI